MQPYPIFWSLQWKDLYFSSSDSPAASWNEPCPHSALIVKHQGCWISDWLLGIVDSIWRDNPLSCRLLRCVLRRIGGLRWRKWAQNVFLALWVEFWNYAGWAAAAWSFIARKRFTSAGLRFLPSIRVWPYLSFVFWWVVVSRCFRDS